MMNFDEHVQIIQQPDLLAGIIGSAMDAIIAINDAQRIVLFNSAAERIFVCTANEAIGNSIERFIPERFRAEHSTHVCRFAESGVTNRTLSGLGTLWGLRATGEEFPIEASISKVESGGKKFFAVVIRDITERHRAENGARENEQRLRLAQQAANIGTFEWNIQEDENTWTPELEAMYGLPPGGFGGTHFAFESLVYGDDRPGLRNLVESTLKTGQPTKGEWRVVWPDGSVHWLAAYWQVLMDESGKPSRVIGVNMDITERKLAEKTLRESEERFRLAAQAGRMYAYEWDVATDIIARSGDIASVLGSTGEASLTRQQLLARIHPDDRALFDASVAERTPEHPDAQISYRLLRPDGSFIWLEKTAHAFFDEQDRMLRMIGMVADITERKRSEEARLRHAAIVESSEDAIASVTLDGVIATWNEGSHRMFGYTENEAVGQPVTILVPPELADEENKILETVKAGGRIKQFETIRITKTGKRINVSLTISPITDSTGKIVGCAGIARDITERKQAENKLREYERAVELSEEAMAVVDRDYRFVIANRKYLRLRKMTKEQVVGHLVPEVLNGGVFESVVKEKLDECFQGKLVRYELKYAYPELGERDVLVSYFPIEGANGVDRVASIMEDITDRKQLERVLTDMSRKLIEAQEQERARIARELHDDISQRLAMLSVALEGLRDIAPEARHRAQELRKELSQISADVQALSHELHDSKLEYLGAIAAIRSWCKEFAERHRMDIDFKTGVQSVLPIEVGLTLFRVLQEALHNATKHSGMKRIEVQLSERSGQVHLIVDDKGVGFDVETAMKGRGLGLTSMKERVRLVNGTIAIESKPMNGTKIHVCVPFVPGHESRRTAGLQVSTNS